MPLGTIFNLSPIISVWIQIALIVAGLIIFERARRKQLKYAPAMWLYIASRLVAITGIMGYIAGGLSNIIITALTLILVFWVFWL